MKKFDEILSKLKFEKILSTLGMNRENGLYYTDENGWKIETSFPNRVKRLIEQTIKPTAFFCFDNKPMILFFVNPSDKKEIHKKIWNFNESPVAIIIENNSVEIFNGFAIDENTKLLQSFGGQEKLNDFSYFELVTGRTWKEYEKELNYKNRVDYLLLQNIKAARHKLVNEDGKKAKLINAILGKVIFVRYLIDREVKITFDGKLRTWNNLEFCNLFDNPKQIRKFFEYLEDKDKGFNGDLFPISSSEYEQLKIDDYQVVKNMLLGVNLHTNQTSLFQLYDFSILPIEFISNVYELFIGEDNQRKEGVYYTPLFLVDYILKETVEEKLSKQDGNYNCKVLDPACGSGIFLVETLRKIIEKYISVTRIKINTDEFKEEIKKLAQENIYGIDKDLSAIQVAIFSIYLTLLDYLEPPEIENFKFPVLLNKNFFVSDFFDENADFNKQLIEIELDFILGNPPWMRGKGLKIEPLFVKYIKKRREKEQIKDNNQIEIGNKEIAQAFLLRSSDFSNNKTKCSLIVTSKVLYNLQSKSFRKYFLHNYFIQKVFELAPVRREVFHKSSDKAIAPACVLFFSYANNASTNENIIEHIALKPSRFFSLFKIFTINKADFKKVQQSKLKEFDWLWKVLVYGTYLDFNFINRLKTNFSTIEDRIKNGNDLIIGQGIMVGGGDKNDTSDLVGSKFVDTRSDIKQFWINPNNKKNWNISTVHRVRKKLLFKAPILLITEGVRIDLKSVSAICYYDAVYKSSLTGIKGKDRNTINILRQISGIINSSFFSYFNLMTFSSSGIEREQSHDREMQNVPFIESTSIHQQVKKIEELLLYIYNDNYALNNVNIESEISTKLLEIEQNIYGSFSLSKQERDLIDYTNKVIIPLIMRHENYEQLLLPINFNDKMFESYAQLFIDRFQMNLNNQDRKFIVEIWHTNQVIGMLFKVIPIKEYKLDIIWKNKQDSDSEILSFLTKLSSEKITDRLFVQKDVRGFDKDSFYIFKPNEKRLWHEAIGYLDVNEFADAILEAGRKTE